MKWPIKTIALFTLASMLTVTPIIGDKGYAATVKVTKSSKSTKSVHSAMASLEKQGKTVLKQLNSVYKTLGTLDSKSVSSMQSKYNTANKLVKSLSSGKTRSSYEDRLRKQVTILHAAVDYKYAKIAAGKMASAQSKFKSDYKKDNTNLPKKLSTLKKYLTDNHKDIKVLPKSVYESFKRKYYNPGMSLVASYKKPAEVETAVISLESYGRKLKTHLNTIYKDLGTLDTTLLSKTTSVYKDAYNKANQLKGSTEKTMLLKRISVQNSYITKANYYKNAKSASTKLLEAKNEFTESFVSEDIYGSMEYLHTFKKELDIALAAFNKLGGDPGTLFKTKYYNPSYSLISKYVDFMNVDTQINQFSSDIEINSPIEKLRCEYDAINLALKKLPNSVTKNELQDDFNDLVGSRDFSGYQSSLSSADTGMDISIDGITVGTNQYTIYYTLENDSAKNLQAGQFKFYFKNGTTQISGTTDTIYAGESKKLSVTINNVGSEAYLMEYGKGLKEEGDLTYNTIYWKVSPLELPEDYYEN